jgi:hypothetical protein
MKKVNKLAIGTWALTALVTASLYSAHSVQAASSTPALPAANASKATASTTTTATTPAVSYYTKDGVWTGVKKLNHDSVTPLIVEAEKRYVYTSTGGKPSTTNVTFSLNNKTYRYLSTDIDTHAKLLAYLKETYTQQASEAYIQKYIIENNGKLAQLVTEKASMLEFNRSTAKMISMTDTARVYRLTVPYVKDAYPVERMLVKFELVNGFWKINTSPSALF